MKNKNSTPKILLFQFLMGLSLLVVGYNSAAQPDYDFRNPILVSGSARQVNALYRFPNVKPGVDCLVRIISMSGGMTLADIDGPGGFAEAFQPVINCAARSNGNVEFRFTFVYTGSNIAYPQSEIPATPIDVDGEVNTGGSLYEFDQIDMNGGQVAFDLVGTELQINQSGTVVTGKNTTAVTYNGIDTVQRSVMFTVYNNGISSFTLRVGADNRSGRNLQRLRSVYFKKFQYPGILLSGESFKLSAERKDRRSNLDAWLVTDRMIKEVQVERSENGQPYEPFNKIRISNNPAGVRIKCLDQSSRESVVAYRMKAFTMDGNIIMSNLVSAREKFDENLSFNVFPTVVNDGFWINISTKEEATSHLFVIDNAGRKVMEHTVNLESGGQRKWVPWPSNTASGNYKVVMSIAGKQLSANLIRL